MIQGAGSRNPGVALASPVGHSPRAAQASCSSLAPAARWMAPSTPPPPARAVLAALTTASTLSPVMSPRVASILSTGTLLTGPDLPLALPPTMGDDHIAVITSVQQGGGAHARLLFHTRSGGSQLARQSQLPRGRPRPLLPRAGGFDPGGKGGLPGMRC